MGWFEDKEGEVLYEIEHAVAEIIGPTEVGEDGFYQMMQVQMLLEEYRKRIELRVLHAVPAPSGATEVGE